MTQTNVKLIKPVNISPQSVIVPGSKSISHRMMICASLAHGHSKVCNLLESEDILLTIGCLQKMGATINKESDGTYQVTGFSGHPAAHDEPIYLGNSGTSMRLLAGIAALGSAPFTLTGDDRMCERPMGELLDALKMINVTARSQNGNQAPPVEIKGGGHSGGTVTIDCSKSGQYLSALLLIGGLYKNGLDIRLTAPPVSSPYIDLTIDIMKKFDVTAVRKDMVHYHVPGGQRYRPGEFFVEPDLSNAGYFWVIGAVTGKMIHVENINRDSLQGDLKQVDILQQMGCRIDVGEDRIGVCGQALKGIEVDMSDTPDAVPAIAVAASFANGVTRIRNIGHLREKECDRIDAVCSQLQKMGIRAVQGEDWIEITGGRPRGAVIETYNDHRIAMAFSIPGLLIEGVQIENPACVKKSFPGYWDAFDRLAQQEL
jgi:3-phosphoshikimate 1-carboxyvinyltransferase